MPWVRVDDNALGHRKFERASDRLLGFWLRGLLYAARNLTDGKIPRSFAQTKVERGLADELVKRQLWETSKDGWLIHDFLDYHPSKEAVEHSRRLNRERQARWRNGVTTSSVTGSERVTNAPPYLSRPSVPDQERSSVSNGATGNGELKPMPPEMREEMAAIFERKSVPPVSDCEVRNEAVQIYGRTLDSDEVG